MISFLGAAYIYEYAFATFRRHYAISTPRRGRDDASRVRYRIITRIGFSQYADAAIITAFISARPCGRSIRHADF